MNKKTKKKTKEKEVEKGIVFVTYFNSEDHYDLTVEYNEPNGTSRFATLQEAKKHVIDHYRMEIDQCREQMAYLRKLKIKDLIKQLLDEAKDNER